MPSLIRHNRIFLSTIATAVVFALAPEAQAAPRAPLSVSIQADGYAETVPRETVSSWLNLKTTPSYDPAKRQEIEGTDSCPTLPTFCEFSLSRATRSHIVTKLESAINQAALSEYIDGLADRAAADPENAVFSADENGAIMIAQEERAGRSLQKTEALAALSQALSTNQSDTLVASLPTEVVAPAIVASDRERLGLKELIGTGKTNFHGSTKNRIYNINRALEQFQGALIAPGETFSFVTVLGEVDGEHGYLPELVIKDNKTQPEFGGGICQVSSTVFRAAINTGLKIVERRNHAYPVHYYYPYGMDATVYVPKPDLRFKNNTPGYILMQSSISGTELTFRFFGTGDGRSVKVDGPHILESHPDGSMKTVFSQLVTDASGNDLINDSFWSNYKSPSLFPHPGQDPILTAKPSDWSKKQWDDYKKIHP